MAGDTTPPTGLKPPHTDHSYLHSERGETCARCGATFECGMKAGRERCWCAEVPPIAPDAAASSCLCPGCLQLARRERPASS
ncbi:MAG TPA: cysteine-rich CWC family protein [Burkholderiales bacterium]|nr:cysteine-rich CWC family protein [Burkholderiales bacterium]